MKSLCIVLLLGIGAQGQAAKQFQPIGQIRAYHHRCQVWMGRGWISLNADMGALQCEEKDGQLVVIGSPDEVQAKGSEVLGWTSAEKPDDNPPCQSAKLYYNGVLADEEPRCGFLIQPVNMPTALDDITRQEFSEAAQRAADETDGKPHRISYESVDKIKPVDPVDVPAVQVGGHLGFDGCGQSACFDHWVTDYTCTDKSRVLLTSEDGKKHCIKF